MSWRRRLCVLLLLLSASSAQARVFSFQDNWVAAYFRGTAGNSAIGSKAYDSTSGSVTSFADDGVDYNFSGEIGFVFLMGDQFSLRVGIEGLQTKGVSAEGMSTNLSTKSMSVDSKVTAFNPVISGEYNFSGQGNSRYYAFGGAGYTNVKVANEYDIDGPGNADYSTAKDLYKEAWYANTISYHAGLGLETYMLDNVTFNMEVGYRLMAANDLYYEDTGSVIRGTGDYAVSKGAKVRDNDGSVVELDLSGLFVGIMFRFYIPPLN